MKKKRQKIRRRRATQKPSVKKAPIFHLQRDVITICRPILAQFFLLVGVFGICLTLIEKLESIFLFADWIRVATKWWFQFCTSFWSVLLGWVGFKLYPETVTVLTFYLMLFAVCFSGLISSPAAKSKATSKKTHKPGFSPDWWKYFDGAGSHLSWALATSSIAMLLFWLIVEVAVLGETADFSKMIWISLGSGLVWLGVLIGRGVREAIQALAVSLMIAIIYSVFAIPAAKLAQAKGGPDLNFFHDVVVYYSVGHFSVILAGILSWASPDYLIRRLTLIAGAVCFILVMNWLSFMAFDIQPAPIQKSARTDTGVVNVCADTSGILMDAKIVLF